MCEFEKLSTTISGISLYTCSEFCPRQPIQRYSTHAQNWYIFIWHSKLLNIYHTHYSLWICSVLSMLGKQCHSFKGHIIHGAGPLLFLCGCHVAYTVEYGNYIDYLKTIAFMVAWQLMITRWTWLAHLCIRVVDRHIGRFLYHLWWCVLRDFHSNGSGQGKVMQWGPKHGWPGGCHLGQCWMNKNAYFNYSRLNTC